MSWSKSYVSSAAYTAYWDASNILPHVRSRFTRDRQFSWISAARLHLDTCCPGSIENLNLLLGCRWYLSVSGWDYRYISSGGTSVNLIRSAVWGIDASAASALPPVTSPFSWTQSQSNTIRIILWGDISSLPPQAKTWVTFCASFVTSL